MRCKTAAWLMISACHCRGLADERRRPEQAVTWEQRMETAARLAADGQYREAADELAAAWRLAQAFPPEDPRVPRTLCGLAQAEHSLGRFEVAEDQYRRALRRWEQTGISPPAGMATCLNSLAGLYLERGQTGAAERICRRVRAIPHQRTENEEYHLQVNLAAVHYQRKEYEQAVAALRVALAGVEARGDPSKQRAAVVLHNLGQIAFVRGRYPEARDYFSRAVQTWEDLGGPHHPGLMRPLRSLADVQVLTNDPLRAAAALRRALSIAETAYGPDHAYAIPLLDALAAVLRKTGAKAEALQLKKRAGRLRDGRSDADPFRHTIDWADLVRKRRQ